MIESLNKTSYVHFSFNYERNDSNVNFLKFNHLLTQYNYGLNCQGQKVIKCTVKFLNIIRRRERERKRKREREREREREEEITFPPRDRKKRTSL